MKYWPPGQRAPVFARSTWSLDMDMDTTSTVPQEQPPDTAEAMDVYREIATKVGLIRSGDPMDQNLIDAFGMLIEKAAMVADEYETDHGNAGEHIRAVLYPY